MNNLRPFEKVLLVRPFAKTNIFVLSMSIKNFLIIECLPLTLFLVIIQVMEQFIYNGNTKVKWS